MRSINTFVVRPDWSSLRSESGLYLGDEVFDNAEDMPVHLYPIKGEVVTSPKPEVIPGDTLYFTWNGVSFNKCVSPISENNLFALNHAWYAYRSDGVLKTTDDYFLIKPIASEIRVTDSGLVIGGAQILGTTEDPELVSDQEDVALMGYIEVLPQISHGLKIGDKVCITSNSDVKVKVEGTHYYRVRASEILFKYESEQ